MFGKMFNLAGGIALAALLAMGGFVGYLYGTGKINATRVDRIAAVLRGELDELPTESVGEADVDAAPDAGSEPRARTSEEVQANRRREHLESLRLERAARDLEAKRRLLDQVMGDVVRGQEALAAREEEFEKKRKYVLDAAMEEGFQKELELVESMSPRQAKEHVINVWNRHKIDAVRLMAEMDTGRARRILETFKTPEELEIQTDLLEQIRVRGMEGYASTSGKTEGAAAP